MTTTPAGSELAEACASWQGGRDIGSSLLRGAARVLTGIPHYFTADFITGYEEKARSTPAALDEAGVLLRALALAPHRTADEWCTDAGLPHTGFAGRGLEQNPTKDHQIAAALASGHITMPLWGLSLSPAVAVSFGSNDLRWIFEIVGPFPAIAAWQHSGIKEDEQELICGGRYSVQSLANENQFTRAQLIYDGPCVP
jgi:hypothetical protein